MKQRNANDGEIASLLRTHPSIAWEVDIMQRTEGWSEADFIYAIDHLNSYVAEQERPQMRELFKSLLREWREADARAKAEEAHKKRHQEISSKLEELKKPHWSIVPNFWMTTVIVILTAILVFVAVLALRH